MHPRNPRGCVLIAEDPLICRFVGGILKREGYVVVETEPEAALRILRAGDDAVSLLITNQPARFLEFAETIPLIYTAAFPDPKLADRFLRCRMLRKPFPPGELMALAAELAPPERR